jgi:hypothetical protein
MPGLSLCYVSAPMCSIGLPCFLFLGGRPFPDCRPPRQPPLSDNLMHPEGCGGRRGATKKTKKKQRKKKKKKEAGDTKGPETCRLLEEKGGGCPMVPRRRPNAGRLCHRSVFLLLCVRCWCCCCSMPLHDCWWWMLRCCASSSKREKNWPIPRWSGYKKAVASVMGDNLESFWERWLKVVCCVLGNLLCFSSFFSLCVCVCGCFLTLCHDYLLCRITSEDHSFLFSHCGAGYRVQISDNVIRHHPMLP